MKPNTKDERIPVVRQADYPFCCKAARWFLSGALLFGCTPTPSEDLSGGVTVAALTSEGCTDDTPRGLPEEVDALALEMSTETGQWQRLKYLTRTEEFSRGELLVEDVPQGEGRRFRLIGCVGERPYLVGLSPPRTIEDDEKHLALLHLRPVEALSCPGTRFGAAYSPFTVPEGGRFLGTWAPLPDGRFLMAGGADNFSGLRFEITGRRPGWTVFDPYEALYLPGIDRAQPLEDRALLAPRVGAVALPFPDGVLLAGGAQAISWDGTSALGPLKPGAFSQPTAEVFVPALSAPVAVQGTSLEARALAAVAWDDEYALIAGGITAGQDGALTGSSTVEILRGRALQRAQLKGVSGEAVGLVGATVTALGEGRFLILGADLEGCGARGAWLVRLEPQPQFLALTFEGQTAPSCADAPGCRLGYNPTGYHTATRLADGELGPRVLVVGGIPVRGQALQNNPGLGECPVNAQILEVNAETAVAYLAPVTVTEAANPLARRALHSATLSDGRVLLTGGWRGLPTTPTALTAEDSILVYTDETQTLDAPSVRLSTGRLGHLAFSTAEGMVVLSDGVSAEGETRFAQSGELFVPSPPASRCRP